MTDEKIFQLTVMRQKGWPIQSAYEHTVEVRPHPPETFEGQCLVRESDFHPEVWAEIVRRSNVLRLEPYVAPEERASKPSIGMADKVRGEIDQGRFSDPLPITHTPVPPPKFRPVAQPIKGPEPDFEAFRREMKTITTPPEPEVHDAVTGEVGKVASTDESRVSQAKKRGR